MTPPTQNDLVIVDTNVVSYIFRDDPIGEPYRIALAEQHRAISFQTYAELMYGALSSNWGQRRINDLVEHIIDNYVVLGCNRQLVVVCARLRAQSRRIGRELSAADAWIAATAVLLNCPLLSHDRDFGNLPGLEVIHYDSPADDAQH